MKGKWWKFSGAVIMIYVILVGMLTPLKPGITSTGPSSALAGKRVEMAVTGYNTHFKTAHNHRAWLKLDSLHTLPVSVIETQTETEATLVFDLPEAFPDGSKMRPLTLIVDNEEDGAFVQPNALFVTVSDTTANDASGWKKELAGQFHQPEYFRFPYRNILNETIRNTFFHVAIWFAMFILLIAGLYHAVMYLKTQQLEYDIRSSSYNKIAIMYGILGLLTGSVWAKFTWNAFWTTDVKLNMTAVAMLIYLAYLVLRGAGQDTDRRAKISASYSIFAFLALIPLVFVIPRMTDSLHPGNGGNPALGGEDLNNTLRIVFYPAIAGLTLLGIWMASLLIRYEKLKDNFFSQNKNGGK
jgi:heme exporter protein C